MRRLLYAVAILFCCTAYRPVSRSMVRLFAQQQPDNDSVPRLNNTAVKLAWNRNYNGALQLLQRAAVARSSDTLLYNQAIVLGRMRRYEEAGGLLRSIPSCANAQANQGVYLCIAGDPRAGLSVMESASVGRGADKLAFNRAVAHLQIGNYQEASQAAQEAIRMRGGEPMYRLVKGDALLGLGEFRAALAIYQPLVKQERLLHMIPVRIGNALLGLKRYEDAAEFFQNYLLSGDRTYQASARFGLGNAFYGQKEFAKAVLEYRRAVQFQPQWVQARTGLGNALCSTRDYKSARIEYEAALALEPANPHIHLGLGVVSYRQGLYEQAREQFEQARPVLDSKDAQLADCFLSRGMTNLELNRLDSSLVDLQVAMRLSPRHPAAYAGASEVYRKKESFRYTLELLERAIQLSPQNDKMLTNKGNMYLKVGNMEEAYSNFSWALKHNYQNVNALNGLSISLLEKDRIEQAQFLLDSLIARGQHKAFLYNNRGIVRSYLALKAEKQKEYHQAKQLYYRAVRDYERARDLDSTHKTFYNNLGNVYKNTQLYDKAVEHYQGHLDRTAINNMGVLFAVDKKGNFGRHYLNIAIRLDSLSLVYQYNRFKVYQEFFKDSLAHRPDVLQAQHLLPTNSISAKYSRDGYINVYLYDYDFERYEFPGDHYFPVQQDHPAPPDYRPLDDLLTMTIPPNRSKIRQPESIQIVTKRMPKPKKARAMGSTKCPKII